MIVYCPYNWARSAAAVLVWVDHLQAVFGRSPGRRSASSCHSGPPSAASSVVMVIVFLELFGPQFWFPGLVSFSGVRLSALGLLVLEDATVKGNRTPVSLPDRWSHQISLY